MDIGDRWLTGLPVGHFDHDSALTLSEFTGIQLGFELATRGLRSLQFLLNGVVHVEMFLNLFGGFAIVDLDLVAGHQGQENLGDQVFAFHEVLRAGWFFAQHKSIRTCPVDI